MALTLVFDNATGKWTAPATQEFTVEVRQKDVLAAIVTSAYNAVAKPGPRPKHTAVAAGKTLGVIYEATREGKRVELWEVKGTEEQRLTWKKHKAAEPWLPLEIN